MVVENCLKVAVIGGGPAGLMAAEVVSAGGDGRRVEVTIYDRMPTLGRRLLMAGRGGLNLTHSEDLARLLQRYGEQCQALEPAIEALPPEAVRSWCEGLGQQTFVGSSGRVFPRAMKASPLLRAWLQRLAGRGVTFKVRHRWRGWNADGGLQFETPAGPLTLAADATVLALGGASWPGLGADPAWVAPIEQLGVKVAPLLAANCGFAVAWSDVFRSRFEGEPLKRVAISFNGQTVRGEALVTAAGIEGGAVYALAPPLREAIAAHGPARITIDLRPDIDAAELVRLVDRPRARQSQSSFLRKAVRLPPVAIGLLQEAARAGGNRLGDMTPADLATLIQAVPLTLTAAAPIEKAISTAGGIAFAEIDAHYMLVRKPGVFVAGEMLDWEAPTGGYLLQGALSTGAAAGRGALQWLADHPGWP